MIRILEGEIERRIERKKGRREKREGIREKNRRIER